MMGVVTIQGMGAILLLGFVSGAVIFLGWLFWSTRHTK